FANAGVALEGLGVEALFDPLTLAIVAGLVLGKQVGIFSIVYAADKLGIAKRPENCTWPEIWGTSVLCGIGFTMSLFISALAFPQTPFLIEEAKLGILTGSAISAVLGYLILRMTTTHPEEQRQPA
ncbi:MAG TPA: Na+/H+ antiporter NhaA, partial [Sphingomonadaceae bacterium]|nr:Na+/H+ antiporter NhaA [Sphingomonadaceae bacterium]